MSLFIALPRVLTATIKIIKNVTAHSLYVYLVCMYKMIDEK